MNYPVPTSTPMPALPPAVARRIGELYRAREAANAQIVALVTRNVGRAAAADMKDQLEVRDAAVIKRFTEDPEEFDPILAEQIRSRAVARYRDTHDQQLDRQRILLAAQSSWSDSEADRAARRAERRRHLTVVSDVALAS